ncbi:MAG TPA: glycosyltransferase [Bacteroidales bacterium]|nr:glycosyltransferase [Bacteroidales bacterium]
MKILVLSSKPPWPPHDGGAVATLRCIEGLARNGASVSLLAMRTQKHNSAGEIPPKSDFAPEYYQTVGVNTSINPLSLLANYLFSDAPFDLSRFRSRKFSRTMQTLLKKENFDIIQCEGLVFSEYLEEIRNVTKTPVIMRAHNVEHRIREMSSLQSDRIFEKVYLKNLASRLKKREIYAANHFDAIVPISSTDMEWFTAAAPGKPMIQIETGINDMPVPNPVVIDSPRVGFIGALDWRPNADGLIWFLQKVWPYVSKRMPAASLHIAGRNAPEKVRMQMTGKNVFFEGEVPDSNAFISSMCVMIAPLFAGSGIRIKIVEAMSLGKVVVATPLAAEGLPVADRREIMTASDQFMFISALIEILGRHDMREQISAAAFDLVRQKFNNRKLTARLNAFYKDISSGR